MNPTDAKTPEEEPILSPEEIFRERLKIGIVGSVLFIVFIVALYFSPIGTGFDWTMIHRGLSRIVQGENPYIVYDEHYGYFYSPWISLIFAPLAFLPVRIGWAFMNALSFLTAILLARRYKLSLLHIVLLLLSPPMVYIIIQGQVDFVLLLPLLLPYEFRVIAALTKPQVAGGLAFTVVRKRSKWLGTILISVVVIGLSFFFWGNWLKDLLDVSNLVLQADVPHNVLRSLWPIQLIFAIPFLAVGLEKDDERIFIASSPFLFRYAASGSFIGLTLVSMTVLRWWQALLFILTWWAIYFLR